MTSRGLGRQHTCGTVGIPLARGEGFRQIIVAGKHGALSVSSVDDLPLVKHVVIVFHMHAMLAILGRYAGLWEQRNPFVCQTALGVLDLQIGIIGGSVFDEGIERVLAIMRVQRSRPTGVGQQLGALKTVA